MSERKACKIEAECIIKILYSIAYAKIHLQSDSVHIMLIA